MDRVDRVDRVDQVGQFNASKRLAAKNTLNWDMVYVKALRMKTHRDFLCLLQIVAMPCRLVQNLTFNKRWVLKVKLIILNNVKE